ncbi:MAG: ribonuclease P protein component [Candidatus Staskawiczbacteria bacterium]|jgi:ribonuclease P protein component
MLPKTNRVTKQKDFDRIFKGGASFKEKFLILKVIPTKKETNRFAFIISKKVSKNATVRNKIKRQLREVIRAKMEEIRKGVECVIIVLPGFNIGNSQEIRDALELLLLKAKLVK